MGQTGLNWRQEGMRKDEDFRLAPGCYSHNIALTRPAGRLAAPQGNDRLDSAKKGYQSGLL